MNTPVQKHGRRFDDKENESVLSEADWDDESMLMESLSGVSVARVAPNNVCLVPQQYETPLFPVWNSTSNFGFRQPSRHRADAVTWQGAPEI